MLEHLFEVGSKVKTIKDIPNKFPSTLWDGQMMLFLNSEATITHHLLTPYGNMYLLDIDSGSHLWHEDLIRDPSSQLQSFLEKITDVNLNK